MHVLLYVKNVIGMDLIINNRGCNVQSSVILAIAQFLNAFLTLARTYIS